MKRAAPIRLFEGATVLLVVSVLAGCAQAHPIPRAPSGDPIAAARGLPDAPDAVRAGDAADSCGAFVLDQGERVPTEAIECLAAAASAGDSAELAWSTPTVEGDPIVHFAFAASDVDRVIVHRTNAFDSYGGDPTWTKAFCADAVAATDDAACPAS